MQQLQSSKLPWCGRLVQPCCFFATERLTCDCLGLLIHQSYLLPQGQILLCYPTRFCFLPLLLILPAIEAGATEATPPRGPPQKSVKIFFSPLPTAPTIGPPPTGGPTSPIIQRETQLCL